jgi:hypothetical protein
MMLWACAVFRRDRIFFGSLFARLPGHGGDQVVRKVLRLGVDLMPLGRRWLIIASVRKAQVGREFESSR